MMASGADRGPSVVAAMLLVGSLTAPPAGELPLARVRFDSVRDLLVIESPAADLPAGTASMPAMVDVPPSVVSLPRMRIRLAARCTKPAWDRSPGFLSLIGLCGGQVSTRAMSSTGRIWPARARSTI
jgi:hypothetical protein